MQIGIRWAVATILGLCLVSNAASAQEAPAYGAPISFEAAKKVMAAAETEAMENGWNVAITVLDSGGHVVMKQRFDNTSYGSMRISEGKARTALEFRRPTKAFQDMISEGGSNMRLLSVPDLLFLQGGVLIVEDGLIVGSIGVSGVTSAQDEQIALAGAAAVE
ncbi:MAG: heme-binding protein [Rhodospirillaceae bacterium]